MSTQTLPNAASSLIKFADNMRAVVASMTEDVRKAASEDKPFYPDRLHELGETLGEIDGAFAQVVATLTPYAGNLVVDFSLGQNTPNPDALFESRRIVIHHDRKLCGFYALRVGSGEAPCYGLGHDGWDEWRPSMRPVRVFETEFQARYAAANTPLPGEPWPAVPVETAVIVLCDCPEQEEVSLSVTLHPYDALFGREDGAHNMARWVLDQCGFDDVVATLDRLAAARKGGDDPDQPSILGDLNSAILVFATDDDDGDPGDEHAHAGAMS